MNPISSILLDAGPDPSRHLNVLLLLGVAVFGGTVGARIFRRFRVPQIIGSILIGLLIGQSGLRLVSEGVVQAVEPLNYFALGIIGFLIGGELKLEILRKYGKQFTAILVAEGVAAFTLVAGATILLTYLFTRDLRMSVALGVVLGAISSATDPASTIQVLWEYKTRGALTTAVIAVVALDDAMASTLYAIGTSVAGILTGNACSGIAASLATTAYELAVSLILGRSVGKIGGAYLGGKWSGASACVRNYLGICLFAQGGVAIGLSILASHRFTPEISSMVILVVASTTFIVQLAGPLFVKLGVKRVGEIGLNVREEDLIDTFRVADVLDAKVPIIPAGTPLKEVIRIVSGTEAHYYPVVDRENRLARAVTLHGIRSTFATQELNDWLVALDIMERIVATTTPQTPLAEALGQARRYNLDRLPVVEPDRADVLAGVLDCPAVYRSLAAEVLSRQQKADNTHDAYEYSKKPKADE
ncbi:MAG TPA: cation:proton antiporter [Sedimentisphaerales bacterium]|nr:cation:proton antiporter [Sedimentisphaerales bacterium]